MLYKTLSPTHGNDDDIRILKINQTEYVKYKLIENNPKKIEKVEINAKMLATYIYSPVVMDRKS